MADSAVATAGHDVHAHHELGFWRTYIFSTDHKMIGRQFLFLGLFMLVIGGTLAMLMRWQLAWPETAVPGFGWVPEPYMFGGVIPPDTYNAFFTMHATIMIFFAVMPILIGCFGNFLIPLMIGARDMAFPLINMRAPGMTWFRLPLVIWSLFITAILLLLALPVLTAALGMLLFDRMAGTSFFLPAGGGQPLLWQHLFWFFGHPEVYILVLPAMGVTSDCLSTFSRKPIFGYHAMAFSMITIAFLSWIEIGRASCRERV